MLFSERSVLSNAFNRDAPIHSRVHFSTRVEIQSNMNRNDYDDRRRRPLTGLGPEYQNAAREPSSDSRFPHRSLRMNTQSLEEAVDRHRSRSPYAAHYGHERGPAGAPFGSGGVGGGGGPGAGTSMQRHHPYHHSTSAPTPTSSHHLDAATAAHHSRGERRSGADLMVPQDMAASFEQYERPMDPRAFREECRKAYMEAAAARQRNAEMSVWGRCSWATYDKYDPRNRHRRQWHRCPPNHTYVSVSLVRTRPSYTRPKNSRPYDLVVFVICRYSTILYFFLLYGTRRVVTADGYEDGTG